MECDIDLVRHYAKKFAQRSCLSKARYPSGQHALRHVIRRLAEMPEPEASLGAYRCNICRGWHLTSKTAVAHWTNDLLMVARLPDGALMQRAGSKPWQPYDDQAPPNETDLSHVNYRVPIPDVIDPADFVEADPDSSESDLSHWFADDVLPADPISRRYWLLEMLDIETNFTPRPAEEGARHWQTLKVAAINAALRGLPKPDRCGDSFAQVARTQLSPAKFNEIGTAASVLQREETRLATTERQARRHARAIHARSAPAVVKAQEHAAPDADHAVTSPVNHDSQDLDRQPARLHLVAVTKRNLENHESRSCATKRRFGQPEFVLQAMMDSLRRPSQTLSQLAAYRCDLCSGWHMTRQSEGLDWNPDMFAVLYTEDRKFWVRVGTGQWQAYDRSTPPILPDGAVVTRPVAETAAGQIQATIPEVLPAYDSETGSLSWIPDDAMPADPVAKRFWLLEMLQIETARTEGAATPAAKRERGAKISAIHAAMAGLPKPEKVGNPFKNVAYGMLPADLFSQLCEATKAVEKQIEDGQGREAAARTAARSFGAAMGWCDAPPGAADPSAAETADYGAVSQGFG